MIPTKAYADITRYIHSLLEGEAISMNPFKVTKEEYELNFGEKKNFLKSLIFLIFKGNAFPTKIEDMLINQTIVEYYEPISILLKGSATVSVRH